MGRGAPLPEDGGSPLSLSRFGPARRARNISRATGAAVVFMACTVNRRRALRTVVIAVVALIALVGIGLAAWPEIVRRVAVWRLAVTTGRTVMLEAADLDLFHGRLALRGLRVIDRDGGPLATLERLDVRFSPRELFRRHLRIRQATLQAVTLRIVRTGPSEFNISDLLLRKTPGGAPLAVTVERLQLLGGAGVIEDRTLTPPRTWQVDAVALEAREATTLAGQPPGVLTLGAVVAGSPVALWVTELRLSPLRFRVTVIAREIDASLAALYLPPASPLSPTRGRINATATIDHDAPTGALVSFDVGLAGIELHRPGQEGPFLSAPAVRVTVEDLRVRPGAIELGRLAVDGGTVVLEDARLGRARRWQADGVALEARNLSSARDAPAGTASAGATMAGAQVSVWVANLRLAPLELHATAILRNVDLALLRLSLPPGGPVQPERGVVNASLQVDHDARRGTRLALDAGLSGLELRRPAHFVTAPSLRVTAEDIAFGGGALTVGRVAVGGDRLTLEERTVTPVRTWEVRNLTAEARGLSSRRQDTQGVASVGATVAGATVSAWVTQVRLDPLELHATTTLRNVDLALLRLYLPLDAPVQLSRGTVDLSLQMDHTVADGTRLTGDATLTGLEARGRGAAGTLLVASPSLRITLAGARRHDATLDVGRVELTGSGALADTRAATARVDLAQLRLAGEGLTWPVRGPARVELSARFRDRGELDASGTAQLTAPPPEIAWTAELGVQFRAVDLAPLGAYLPAASGLGGRVRARVTATVAYAGALTARVRGEVGGGRFDLVEGDRTLLSLRRIDVTGLDAQWPERVTVGQLRLQRPYALIERDRQGRFPLAARFAPPPPAAVPQPAGASPTPAARTAGLPRPAIAIGEVAVENGSATLVDEGAPARVDLPRVDFTVRNVTWPPAAPAQLALAAGLPAGGTLSVEGTASAEPARVDLTLALKDADLSLLQPYLGFRASLAARVHANLTVAGPLAPAPRLSVRGDVGLRHLAVSDGQRTVLTVERLDLTGVDAAWPDRLALDQVRMRGSWALIERDGQRRFLLRTLFDRPPAPGAAARALSPAGAGPPGPTFAFSLREAIFEQQAVTVVDGVTTPPARFEVAGARLAVENFTWPSRGPVKIALTSPTPAAGRLEVAGTLELDPIRLDVRTVLEGVALAPAQPYLPIEGRIVGRVTGELGTKITLDPLTVQLSGQARLQSFRLSDEDRPVVTVGRVDTTGIDVDWPRRITLRSVLFRRPRVLIERDAQGQLLLRRLVTPRWTGPGPAGALPAESTATGAATDAAPAPARPPTIEVATLSLERASARFVDQTTTPPYAEELSDVEAAVTGLTTTAGQRAQFTARGALGGGSFTLAGEGARGDPTHFTLTLDLRDFIIPRANPYLDRFTAWMATRGRLSASAGYALRGTRLDARHDLVIRDLDVARAGARDEVRRRLGQPLGLLVSLLKDARGEIRLSLPVSGDVSSREFDFHEAVWGAVRALTIRLLALPFSRIGSLFFSHDSKVEAVAIAPVIFEPGTAHLGPAMPPHLAHVAAFLRGAPSVKVVLEPILTQADIDALRREQVLARLAASPAAPGGPDPLEAARREYRERWPERALPATLETIATELATVETMPADAMRSLGARRLEVVRHELTRGGGLDAGRLAGAARRAPLVEAGGTPRAEFDLRP